MRDEKIIKQKENEAAAKSTASNIYKLVLGICRT